MYNPNPTTPTHTTTHYTISSVTGTGLPPRYTGSTVTPLTPVRNGLVWVRVTTSNLPLYGWVPNTQLVQHITTTTPVTLHG